MQAQDTPRSPDLPCAVIIPFPRRVPARKPSLMSRFLTSFAFAAGCLYPEFVVPLLAFNEVVVCQTGRWHGTPPEKEAA